MYISSYYQLALDQSNFMKFGIWGQLIDVITCVKFLVNQFRGYRVLTPPKFPFPIDLLRRPYNSVLASLKTDRTTARPHSRPHSWMATARPHRRQHKQRPAWTPEITAAVDLWWSAVFRQTPQQCCKCMHAAWPKQDNVPAFKLRTNNSVTN